MDNYTIHNFWQPRLGKSNGVGAEGLVQGWSVEHSAIPTFIEAPLTQNVAEFGGDVDPSASSVLLISAPGAVGKSTLAKQIAFVTGSVYVDLAEAEPVGANTLSGGLVRSRLYEPWENNMLPVLIDGLDEALLKTTKDAFDAFIKDIAALARGRAVPTVLFGRTSAVEDAWLILTDKDEDPIDVAVLEIGYYGPNESLEFAEASLTALAEKKQQLRQHPTVDRQALELLLIGLRNQTAVDGDRFAGYAPVLQAVAARVEAETNPSILVSELNSGPPEQITLQSVVGDILNREKGKLDTLPFRDPALVGQLYLPEEQLDWLVAHVYGGPVPALPDMCPEDGETYSKALDNWVGTHPFLGGGNPDDASVVFQAAIGARALTRPVTSQSALQRELSKGDAANPFLYTFYMNEVDDTPTMFLPEEHIGCFYSSLRASLAHGEAASLLVEEIEDEMDKAWVEVELTRASGTITTLEFETGVLGPVRLGAHVKDALVIMPQAFVEIGQGSEVVLVAPIVIQCKELDIHASKVIAQNPTEYEEGSAVILKADEFTGQPMSSVPTTRGNVELLACWPGVEQYPWNGFASELDVEEDLTPEVTEGLRRFRMFAIAFRARGNRRLGKSTNKMESIRMTKGSGKDVLDLMVAEGIVAREGSMYILRTDRLSELTGATYVDFSAYRFNQATIEFVQKALTRADS